MRADENNNPTAFTVNIAQQGGLKYGTDYEQGTSFTEDGATYWTAKLLSDPIELTRTVIGKIGFYTQRGAQRWQYIALPHFVWYSLTPDQQRDVIGFMYQHEGGDTMRHLFPNYGTL